MKWYLLAFKKYAQFTGRARRKEYWMFTLFNVIFIILLAFIGSIISDLLGIEEVGVALFFLYILVVIVPILSITVRRLHDIGKSGSWFFIQFVPLIGRIWLLVLTATEGEFGDNKYGPNPKNPKNELDDIGIETL